MEAQTFCGLEAVVFKFFLVVALAMVLVENSKGNNCSPLECISTAVECRRLQYFHYWEGNLNSAVQCVSFCHADSNCRSVNYGTVNRRCQLSNSTGRLNPENFVVRCGSVYYDSDHVDLPFASEPCCSSCQQLLGAGHEMSGIYTIYPARLADGLEVYCDMETDGGGWIVFQRRQDGSVDFYRNWTDYRVGFGQLSGEFWLGNDNLRAITNESSWQLVFRIEKDHAWAKYGEFQVLGENYQLKVSAYDANSTLGDRLSLHNGMLFSTPDKHNDEQEINCATVFKSAWWFTSCANIDLNAPETTKSSMSIRQIL